MGYFQYCNRLRCRVSVDNSILEESFYNRVASLVYFDVKNAVYDRRNALCLLCFEILQLLVTGLTGPGTLLVQ